MRKIKNYTVLIITYLIAYSCSVKEDIPAELTNNNLSSDIDIAIDDIYNNHKDNLNTIGLSIGVLKNGETHFYGYGETKKGSGIIPNQNTFYEIGSISKTFTSILTVNMLLQQGLDIETSLRSYLPEDLPTLNRNGIEVNFKHLLTHTSGLGRMPNNFNNSKNAGKEFASYDKRLLYSYIENARLHADPFTQFLYSNVGMGIAGTILERNYEIDFGKVLEQELTLPIGLTNTTAYFEDTNAEYWATGYNYRGKETDYWKTLNALDGAGVIKSTASDLLIYAQANINPPETQLGDAIRLTHEAYFKEYETDDYGKRQNCLGWFEYEATNLPDETFLRHDGLTAGFHSEILINLENQTAVTLLFNKSSINFEGREAFISELLQLLSE
ncbi:serine hydrolase domain-containing protein [Maribacter sp.]|uniref:serine hydrolase domain-containing protein n=1 Tax=Maribacter sp. TaxID=1897614 RepID=UPI0025C5BF94|nr:serine hydrolase domain-containing protein [Maribacter sp.]